MAARLPGGSMLLLCAVKPDPALANAPADANTRILTIPAVVRTHATSKLGRLGTRLRVNAPSNLISFPFLPKSMQGPLCLQPQARRDSGVLVEMETGL